MVAWEIVMLWFSVSEPETSRPTNILMGPRPTETGSQKTETDRRPDNLRESEASLMQWENGVGLNANLLAI